MLYIMGSFLPGCKGVFGFGIPIHENPSSAAHFSVNPEFYKPDPKRTQ